MSPPEVWGPAIWTLFHSLAEKINENAYPYLINSMFFIIVKICRFLPCPECSRDASGFLARIKISDYKTKEQFKNMLYLFHNWVNAKKRKRLFNYAYMNKYSQVNIINVVNNFISKYNTKGNMKLLAESFQRNFVIKDFISWFKTNAWAFINRQNKQPNNTIVENSSHNEINQSVIEESSVETVITEETVVINEKEKEEEKEEIKEVKVEEEIKEEVIEEQEIKEVEEIKEQEREEEIKEVEEIKEQEKEVEEQIEEVEKVIEEKEVEEQIEEVEKVIEEKEEVKEEQVIEEQVIEEKEEVKEEQVIEEQVIEEQVIQEHVIQEEEVKADEKKKKKKRKSK